MEEKECKSCKQKGPSKTQIGGIILGLYLLASSIYGTVVLVGKLISLFK